LVYVTIMTSSIKTDDVIFNFFKQICDEKDDKKCVELGNDWINAMETNLNNMEANLEEADKIKHKDDIKNNRDHLNSLKGKTLQNGENMPPNVWSKLWIIKLNK